jgi:putative heme-binding domain-containing protein
MQIGCPVWGFDNWIYMTYGAGDVERLSTSLGSVASSKNLKIRRDFRFHPLSWEFDASSGFGQFGHTIDSVGHRLFCTNRNPIIAAPILPSEYQRNPQILFPGDQYDVAPSGGDSLVYPLVEMKSNYLSHAGTHTAACGTTAYVGNLLGEQYLDSVMVCEPIGHLITRSIVLPKGSTLKAERARPKADFVASTDTWFRPASLANGPDGALYIADMYRLWVEHPKFLPPEIAAKIDWRAGEDKGRIWRIVPQTPTKPLPSFTPPQSNSDLVRLLSNENGWQRELAQRLLVERQALDVEADLRTLLQSDSNKRATQRALWTLDGIGRVRSVDLQTAIRSTHAVVRKDALRIARKFLSDPAVAQSVLNAASDSNAEVRLECALTLGDFLTAAKDGRSNPSVNSASVAKALAQIALTATNDDWLATAVLTSARDCSAAIVNDVAKAAQTGALQPSPVAVRLIRELASATGVGGDISELEKLLQLIGLNNAEARGNEAQWWRYAALSGLASGLTRNQTAGTSRRNSLSALLSNPPVELSDAVAPLAKLLTQSTALALDSKQPEVDRVAAVDLLAHLPKEQWNAAAQQLFQPEQPIAIQLAMLGQMRRTGSTENAQLVIENWPELGPLVRPDAIAFLLQHKETTRMALTAMQQGTLDAAVINIDQRAILLAHPDAEIKGLATSVFGSGISLDRQEVARQYQASLKLSGDAKAGQVVFERICVACHRFNGRGHDVGPDISDTRNRSREALLYDILDPNQKLEPKYTAYQALTVDGALYQGVLVSETPEAVVLQLAEGKQQTVARSDLEVFKANGKSLMPEGVEKDLTISQMADLLAFLKGER